jgi:hypothetical protein
VRGPFSFSINEELGVVVKGRENPPFVSHGPFGALLRAPCSKVGDLRS